MIIWPDVKLQVKILIRIEIKKLVIIKYISVETFLTFVA